MLITEHQRYWVGTPLETDSDGLPLTTHRNLNPYLNVQVENTLMDHILELFNANGLTAHQAKNL
jgi:hypothetical protein